MGRLVEALWDCPYCGTARIGGSKRECPNCGKARGQNTIFDLGDNPRERYVPEEKAASINRNPDWVCDYCNQLNSDNEPVCVSCGAPRTEENLNYFEYHAQHKQKVSGASPSIKENASDTYVPSYTPKSTPVQRTYQAQHHSTHNNGSNHDYTAFDMPGTSTWQDGLESVQNFFSLHWQTMLISLLVIIGIIGIVFLLLPKEMEITITDFSWERSIEIERYQTVEESDWSLPAGARLQYSQEEFSHTIEVLDHYETKTREVAKERIVDYEEHVSYRDLGNGYYEEIIDYEPIYETYYETETYEEPVYRTESVYRTKYYYEIDKWLYERSVKTSASDHSPYWGETNLASDERISNRYETYTIIGLDEKEKEQTIILSFEDWSSLEIDQTINVKVSLGYGELIE